MDDRLVQRLAGHLEAHLPEMVGRLIDSYRVVDGYQQLDAKARPGLEVVVAANERLFIDELRGRPPGREDMERIAEGAILRLEQGIPLAQVLQAYRLWTVTTWQEVTGFFASLRNVSWQRIVDIAGVLIAHTEFVSAIAANAYTTEESGIWIDADALRGPSWQLMVSGRADPAAVEALEVERFGERRPLRMWVLAPRAAGDSRMARNAAVRELVRRWQEVAREGAIVGVIDGVVSLVAPTDKAGAEPEAAHSDVPAARAAVARGEEHDTLAAALAEQPELRRVVELAARLPAAARPLTWRETLVPAAAAGAEAVVARRLDAITDALRAYESRTGTPLLETVRVYLDTQRDLRACAERLYCHRNTVGYRLRRARELTGLDLADDRDRTIIRLAMARELLRA